ncbi:hypothetical protein GF322_02035 [Candidatus Dependentiae bacterium]|nr:hypothetical protein [Candidatus Dependentiae bacterium]
MEVLIMRKSIKKIFLSFILIFTSIACSNVFSMHHYSLNNNSRNKTKLQARISEISRSFSDNLFTALKNLEISFQDNEFRQFLIKNEKTIKGDLNEGFEALFSDANYIDDSIIFDLSNHASDFPYERLVDNKVIVPLTQLLRSIVNKSGNDNVQEIIISPEFQLQLKNFISNELKKFEIKPGNFAGWISKVSSGGNLAYNSALLFGMLFAFYSSCRAIALIRHGYIKEGIAIFSFFGVSYILLNIFNKFIPPIYRAISSQGQHVYNDGNVLLHGPQRRSELEQAIRNIAKDEAKKNK